MPRFKQLELLDRFPDLPTDTTRQYLAFVAGWGVTSKACYTR